MYNTMKSYAGHDVNKKTEKMLANEVFGMRFERTW